MQLITGTTDFIRHFPPMSAMGARQRPQQGALLSGSGGGGGVRGNRIGTDATRHRPALAVWGSKR
jgi:hypothetical protein